MKICAAQTRPVTGDIRRNIVNHKRLADLAISNGADAIVFPELSLTGYEPKLAKDLAIDQDDSRLDDFQRISDARQITIGIGVPTRHSAGICITMVLLQPHTPRQTYSKKYLHPDEQPFFVSGRNFTTLEVGGRSIAPAICYEISIHEHAENASKGGAEIYVASVAKFVSGIEKALQRLSDIAARYSMTVLMANCVGECDGSECAGKTSIWNSKGVLVRQLNDTDEGILIIDTGTQEVIERTIQGHAQ